MTDPVAPKKKPSFKRSDAVETTVEAPAVVLPADPVQALAQAISDQQKNLQEQLHIGDLDYSIKKQLEALQDLPDLPLVESDVLTELNALVNLINYINSISMVVEKSKFKALNEVKDLMGKKIINHLTSDKFRLYLTA